MAKQLNVNLAFTADTKGAQAQLKQLQQQLDQIIGGKNVDMSLGLTSEIQKGIAAAAELKVKLNDAVNTNTGKLDLTKFSNSLDRSGKQLQDYAKDLEQLGPAGSEAFLSIARAISNADAPLISINAKAQEFLTTLKNTARWQISSSVLHGFMGAIQHAYGYAQDLNESLNNIRIVTGKSSDEMARFAKEANAAARNLSTTTLDYTDASLIYYQQGLTDEQVAGRTDTTIKLANVSRQSAEEVSDQLTAIWNNFYNGSKSLEYYADVITALGAATASSSEEISTGLEKFAAVSQTVGLSYEYATAALATITATTRQSADTVGTGLRTLFARLEGLQLGETLEDGVDLNKYSKALADVGVQILDTTGQMKDMDTILEDLAARWGELDKAQRMALAQTVGGVRQYTNLIALMDNWDFMQENLTVARGSEGTLQEQADIYAESWEAARDRVSAAAEAIYDDLLNDDFFISLLNGFEKALDGIHDFIESLGGLRGVLLGIGAIVTQVFNKSLAAGLANSIQSIKSLTPGGQQAAINKKNAAWAAAVEEAKADGTSYGMARSENIQREAELQQNLINEAKNLTEEERALYQLRLDSLHVMQDQYAAAAKTSDEIEEQAAKAQRVALAQAKAGSLKGSESDVREILNSASRLGTLEAQLSPIEKALEKIHETGRSSTMTVGELKESLASVSPDGLKLLEDHFEQLDPTIVGVDALISDLLGDLGLQLDNAQVELEVFSQVFGDKLPPALQTAIDKKIEAAHALEAMNDAGRKATTTFNNFSQTVHQFKDKLGEFSKNVINVAQGISQCGMAINLAVTFFNNYNEAIKDGSISTEEFLSLATSFGMALPMLINGVQALSTSVATLGKQIALFLAANPIIAAIAVSLIAVGGAIAYVSHENNKAANSLKKAQKAQKEMNDLYKDAKDQYKSLQETIQDYEDSKNAISQLKEGTEEFKDSIVVANDKALELINTFDQLTGKYHFNSNGLIEFDDDALEDLNDSLKDQQQKTLESLMVSRNATLYANNDLSNSTLAQKNNKTYWDYLTGNAKAIIPGAGIAGIMTGKAAAAGYLGTTGALGAAGVTTASVATAAAAPLIAGAVADALVSGGQMIYQTNQDKRQVEALEHLEKAYIDSGDNFTAAVDSLNEADKQLIDSLGVNDNDLLRLCEEVSANTQATIENSKSYVASRHENEIKDSKNQDFLVDLLGRELTDSTQNLYDSTYADKGFLGDGKTDKEIQQAYASLMGYTWDKNLSGNMGRYVDKSGNTIEISDIVARQALAQNEADKGLKIDERSAMVDKLVEEEAAVLSTVDSLQDYINKRDSLINSSTSGLFTNEIQNYLNNYGGSQKYEAGLQLANNLSNIEGIGLSADDFINSGWIDRLSEQLTAQQLHLAVDVAATSESIDDFVITLQHKITQSLIDSATAAKDAVGEIIAEGVKEGQFNRASLQGFAQNDEFKNYLNINNINDSDFINGSYTEQYKTLADFYTYQENLLNKYAQREKEVYNDELVYYQNMLSDATDATEEQKIEAISKIEEIRNKLEELSNQEISISIDWTGTDQIKEGYAKIAELSQALENDVEQVGNSYLMTAAQARKWMDVYPELFETASVTTDGLLELNKTTTDDYINGQDAQVDATVEAKIAELQAAEAQMQQELENTQAELQAAQLLAEGKQDYANLEAQYVMDTHDILLQHFIDAGNSELEAHTKALNLMGINEQQYSAKLAEIEKQNAQNQINAVNDGASAQTTALQRLQTKWNQFKSVLKSAASAVKAALTGGDVSAAWTQTVGAWTNLTSKSYSGGTYSDIESNEISPVELERREAVSKLNDSLTDRVNDLKRAILDNQNQQKYLQLLKDQDLTEFGGLGNKGGKSGSGKDKTINPEDLKEYAERYHEITREIAYYNHELTETEKKTARLYGPEKVASMNKEIDALEVLIDDQAKLVDLAAAYLAIDEQAVKDNFADAKFDNVTHQLTNYTALLEKETETYNKAVEQYNKTGSEADKKALEMAQDAYDKRKAILDQYEKTWDKWQAEVDILEDENRKLQDKYFNRLNYVVELKLKVNENDKKRIETTMTAVGDSVYKATERLDLLWSMNGNHQKTVDGLTNSYGNINDTLDTYNFHLKENQRLKDEGLISDEQYWENLESIRDGLYDQLNALLELDETMRTYYSTTLHDALEELDFWNKQIEHGSEVLEYYQKLLELTGHAADYDSLIAVQEGQAHVAENRYKVAKRTLKELEEQKNSIEQQMLDAKRAGDTERLLWLQDKFKAIEEAYIDAESEAFEYLNAWTEAANALAETSAQKVHKEFEDALTNGLGFDYINADIEKLGKVQDEYLTKTNQVYETTKFLRQIQSDMDKTDSAAQKEKLKNFQKMVEGLREQGKLTQVDLEIAKRRYEVELAQMALEEAKNAKSVVRLSRDNEGNYGYVYSADPDKVGDAEQDLADKQNDLYNYALETYNNNMQKVMELYQSQNEELDALYQEYYDKGLLNSEEYYNKRNEIISRYGDAAQVYLQNLDSTRNALNDVALTDYTEAYTSAYDKIADRLHNWEETSIAENDAVRAARTEATEVAHAEVEQVLGPDFETLQDHIDKVTEKNDEWTRNTLRKVIPSLDEQVEHADAVTDAYSRQRDAIQDVIDAIWDQIDAINALQSAQAARAQEEYESASVSYDKDLDYSDLMNEAVKRGYSVNGSTVANLQRQREAKIVGENMGVKQYGSKGDDVITDLKTNKANGNLDNWNGKYSDDEKFKDAMARAGIHLATGGYTGEFDDSQIGRLAWLHQKELVLNESDTANMLQAVDIIRQITSAIDLNALSAAAGMSYLNSPTLGAGNQVLDQNVHIEANFPSVTDHNEIEEALTTLINRASQFANRK